jgi:hypothetical protein
LSCYAILIFLTFWYERGRAHHFQRLWKKFRLYAESVFLLVALRVE